MSLALIADHCYFYAIPLPAQGGQYAVASLRLSPVKFTTAMAFSSATVFFY